MKPGPAVLCFALAMPVAAHGALVRAAADGFLVEHRFHITAPPATAWQTLLHPERWWPGDHTWSGNAANLSLAPEAGGCFCERWANGSAEHGRVVQVKRDQLLRFSGALGPLQEMAVTGILTVVLTPVGSDTDAIVTYRVSGDASHGLESIAPVVDKVIGLQFGGFAARASRHTR
jgi:uncharacterized protein YndB with AHSA1/START domain